MTKASRDATPDEKALFETVIGGGKLDDAPKDRSATLPRAPLPKPRPAGPSGVDGRTAERLRKGEIEPDLRLDLHGLTEAAAHQAVAAFLRSAIAGGAKLVLIITGKGGNASAPDAPFDLELDRRTRGVLRAMAPRWLQEPEFIRSVADIRTAHRRHGGAGALYVYLRKERKGL